MEMLSDVIHVTDRWTFLLQTTDSTVYLIWGPFGLFLILMYKSIEGDAHYKFSAETNMFGLF